MASFHSKTAAAAEKSMVREQINVERYIKLEGIGALD